MGWIWFVIVQLICLLATVLGWVVLVPFCLAQAWTLSTLSGSVKDGRPIDHWNAGWLRALYDNPEDGVSGAQALVWSGGKLEPFMPGAWPPWRAYCWSAWRNSADNLKYVFKWVGGPFYRWENGKFYAQAGWYPNGFPVLSAGRM